MADKKRILVADDDPDLLDLLKMDLGFQGYEVLVAANGKDALQMAMTEPLDWSGPAPRSPRFDDIYFSPADGLAETLEVFLRGCGLPDAWSGRDRFTVGELGFGFGGHHPSHFHSKTGSSCSSTCLVPTCTRSQVAALLTCRA